MLDFPPVNGRSSIRVRSPEEGSTQISWWAALAVLAVIAVCLFSGLGALGLLGPDEPRYAAIAHAMSQTGDWITPRLYGQPWFEKPVLYYWLAGWAFRIFGVTDFAARLPSALAALLATVAIGWAALRAYGLDAAWLALIMLPATLASIGFSRAATTDMLFSALVTAAAVSAAEMLEKPRMGLVAKIVFGVFLGAATLAKGPAAIVLAGGGALLWALISWQWRAALKLANLASIVAFCVVALPWYLLCEIRNPAFFRIFLLQHNFERYLTPVFQHSQPLWFFGPVLLLALLPWTILLVPLVLRAFGAWRAGTWRDSPSLFFGCWSLFTIVFFSFSSSKLPGYILPAVPLLVLVMAAQFSSYFAGKTRGARWWAVFVAVTLVALAGAAKLWLRFTPANAIFANRKSFDELLAVALVGGIACVLFAAAGRIRIAIGLTAVLIAALVVGLNTWVLPQLDPYVSARAAAHAMPSAARNATSLSVFHLNRSWQYGLNYYLDRELPEWNETATPEWVWTSAADAEALRRQGYHFSVAEQTAPQAWLLRITSRD